VGAGGADLLFSGTWGSSSVVCEEVSSSVDESSNFASFMTGWCGVELINPNKELTKVLQILIQLYKLILDNDPLVQDK